MRIIDWSSDVCSSDLMSPLDAVQLPALAEECRARDIRTILPTRDGELAFWANARSALSDMGVGVIVSMPLPLSRCVDKLAFAEWGAAKELAIIPAAQIGDATGRESVCQYV